MNNMTYSTSDTFSAINNISVSVNSSNFPFFILKLLSMLILVQKVNKQGEFKEVNLKVSKYNN